MAGVLRCVLILTVRPLHPNPSLKAPIPTSLTTHSSPGRPQRRPTSRQLGGPRDLRGRGDRQHPDDLPAIPTLHATHGRRLALHAQQLERPLRRRRWLVRHGARRPPRQGQQVRPPPLPLHPHRHRHRLRQRRTYRPPGPPPPHHRQGRHHPHHRDRRHYVECLVARSRRGGRVSAVTVWPVEAGGAGVYVSC